MRDGQIDRGSGDSGRDLFVWRSQPPSALRPYKRGNTCHGSSVPPAAGYDALSLELLVGAAGRLRRHSKVCRKLAHRHELVRRVDKATPRRTAAACITRSAPNLEISTKWPQRTRTKCRATCGSRSRRFTAPWRSGSLIMILDDHCFAHRFEEGAVEASVNLCLVGALAAAGYPVWNSAED